MLLKCSAISMEIVAPLALVHTHKYVEIRSISEGTLGHALFLFVFYFRKAA